MGKKKVVTIKGDDLGLKARVASKKIKRVSAKQPKVRIYIQSTYNNTLITVATDKGAVLGWSSAGRSGFKGAKKATHYAAQVVVEDLLERLKNFGIKEADVFVRGIGGAREAAVRAVAAQGIAINLIKDITPIPHNGCRPRKPRRV